MKKEMLQTPAIMVYMDAIEHNLKKYHDAAKAAGKQVWPMIKTHKSLEMIDMQEAAGADGYLCGTLDEAEALCKKGIKNIMYAYPVASDVSIRRVINLAKNSNFIIRLDNLDGAAIINKAAADAGITIQYTIIVNAGLNRFGLKPDKVVEFADVMKQFANLKFVGVSSHPGHVYSATKHDEIAKYVADEKNSIATAVKGLEAAGYKLDIVSTGSTPTFWGSLDDENIKIYHPGNYVFCDYIQMSIDIAKEEECALAVYATVISHPDDETYICDAGAKCLGLDQGAHGNSAIKGHGYVKGHPELTIYSLSEEVGKIHADGPTDIKVGDKIEIIPNHSCSTANLTSYYIGVRGDEVERVIPVDIRGNSTTKNA